MRSHLPKVLASEPTAQTGQCGLWWAVLFGIVRPYGTKFYYSWRVLYEKDKDAPLRWEKHLHNLG